ncbi:ovostatin homolog [Ruditapes philippinarum]|uniref:ovostatin homolog n=1 Tax=Ruditapes philippinarum TaxID=129788 RepID=UPI00295B54CC|nr:ovostatin homolog [Ruditapes philippinarum]
MIWGKTPTVSAGFLPTPPPTAMPALLWGMTPTSAAGSFTTTIPDSIAAKEIIRTRFPETWLWEEYLIGASGMHTDIQTVPDGITSWVSSVFATNPYSGFCISDTKKKAII